MKIRCGVAILAVAGLLAACGQQEQAQGDVGATPAAETTAVAAAGDVGAIKARQERLKGFGGALKAMSDELKKPEPQLAVFQKKAPIIDAHAEQLPTWFPAGTGIGMVQVKTGAKPEIWARPDEFKTRATTFAAEAHKFAATAQSGDMAAIRSGVPALGATCKGCHDTFRQRDS